MKIKHLPIFLLIATLAAVSLACSSVSELIATATPLPTSTFTPTPSPTSTLTPTPSPTITPTPQVPRSAASGEPVLASFGSLKLSNALYTHPKGFVSFYPMEGWKIKESDFAVFMSDPDHNVTYSVTATNTGYELDDSAFEQFRKNTEQGYSVQSEYQELDQGENKDINLYYIEKTYQFFNGQAMYTYSIYQKLGSAIYLIELTGPADVVRREYTNAYWVMFDSFSQTIVVHSKIVAQFPIYQWTWDHTIENVGASITVPWSWTLNFNQWKLSANQKDTVNFIYFSSPDNLAGIDIFDMPTVKLVGEAGKKIAVDYSLTYLKSTTGKDDFKIIGPEKYKEDGVYLYSWNSKASGLIGVTILDTRTPNRLVAVIMYTKPNLLETYQDLFLQIGDSYTLKK
jgi:hypothetical protein